MHAHIQHGDLHDAVASFEQHVADVVSSMSSPADVRVGRARRPRQHPAGDVKVVRNTVKGLRRELRTTGTGESKRALRSALRLLSVCKRKTAQLDLAQRRRQEQRSYNTDPAAFLRRLDEAPNVAPEFSQADCEAYFTEVLGDPQRDTPFVAEPWLPPRPTPSVPFAWPSVRVSAIKAILAKQSNKSSPGPDGIGYIVYKRCPALLPYLSHVYARMIALRQFPDSCKYGVVTLLYKSGPATVCSNFRPITLSNTIGKIFLSGLSNAVTRWSVAAGIIDTSLQKGFMPKMPGCVEHSARGVGALKDAKSSGRKLCAAMIDLANAFGSTPHAGLLFAMFWFGLPTAVQELIQNYYSSLRVFVRTKQWRTAGILMLVGVFQGDPFSPIIFNLFLNFLYQWYSLPDHLAMSYRFKQSSLKLLCEGFADDISLFTRHAKDLQYLLNGTDRFLRWARMKAKPTKCKVIAYRRAPQHVECYDPDVSISGVRIPMIAPDDGFKLLGRWFYPSLNLSRQQDMVAKKLTDRLARLDGTLLSANQRLHALRMSLIGWLGWDLSMYDFSISFVEHHLEQPVKNAIARWLRLPPSTTKDPFFLSRRYHGVNIPSPATLFKQRQATTAHMLKYSSDPAVAEFYEVERRRRGDSERWSGILALEQFESARPDAAPAPGDAEFNATADRVRLSRWIRELDDRARWSHVEALVCQGKALRTLVTAATHDRDWLDQMLQVPESRFRFGLMALLDVLPTNSNLFRWDQRADNRCGLCGQPETTLHVLNNCQVTLGKLTWRHNSVLQAIVRFVLAHASGEFRVLVDLPDHPQHYEVFPPSICVTTQRPDLVFIRGRDICVIELTVPLEDNMRAAIDRKRDRYRRLVDDLSFGGYRAELVTIEVGSRGNLGDSLSKALAGFVKGGWLAKVSTAERHEFTTRVSHIALSASFLIWLSRKTATLPSTIPLLS